MELKPFQSVFTSLLKARAKFEGEINENERVTGPVVRAWVVAA